jgi:hypothetical protein
VGERRHLLCDHGSRLIRSRCGPAIHLLPPLRFGCQLVLTDANVTLAAPRGLRQEAPERCRGPGAVFIFSARLTEFRAKMGSSKRHRGTKMPIDRLLADSTMTPEQRQLLELAFNDTTQAKLGGSRRSHLRNRCAQDHCDLEKRRYQCRGDCGDGVQATRPWIVPLRQARPSNLRWMTDEQIKAACVGSNGPRFGKTEGTSPHRNHAERGDARDVLRSLGFDTVRTPQWAPLSLGIRA